MLALARKALEERLGEGMKARVMSDQASAIGRLFASMSAVRTTTITFEIADAFAAAWVDGDGTVADGGPIS